VTARGEPGHGRFGALLALAGLAFVVAGCEYLLGAPFPDEFPSSSPIARFAEGTATIEIDGGDTIELTQVVEGAGIDSMFGSTVRWTGPDGWSMQVMGAGAEEFGMGSAYLTFDRIDDGEHWTTFDPGRCIVDIEVADKDALRGSATCKGVEWYDALGGMMALEPSPLDEPKFDAEVTFEATP